MARAITWPRFALASTSNPPIASSLKCASQALGTRADANDGLARGSVAETLQEQFAHGRRKSAAAFKVDMDGRFAIVVVHQTARMILMRFRLPERLQQVIDQP